MTVSVDVCICTFRRPQLRDTLLSLAALADAPPFHVIVADNDETPSAKALVEATASELGLRITYVHAPARNISIARNACLDAATAPFLAFIDDDEIASPQWLATLVAEAERSSCAIVLGPVAAIYPADCPAWIVEADLHSTKPVWVDGQIITGYTSNVLFQREDTAIAGLRFRNELGRSGGEDTAFFSNAYEKGARIAYAETALLTEPVALERASFKWLARRRFRAGQTHGMLLLEGRGSRGGIASKAAGKAIFCLFMAILCTYQLSKCKYWLLRGILHAGVVARLLGRRETEHYGQALP